MKFKREKTITYHSSQIGLKLACHTDIAHFWFSSITITNRLYLDGSLSLLVPLKSQRKVKKNGLDLCRAMQRPVNFFCISVNQ